MALRTAVISGSNKGIGLELCRQLVASGDYRVLALCRQSSPQLDALQTQHGAEKVLILDNMNVMDENIAAKLQSAAALQQDPMIHLLILNAGAYGPPETFADASDMYTSQTLDNVTAHRLQYAFELNAVAPLLMTKALLPRMVQQPEEKDKDSTAAPTTTLSSKVIVISSLMGSIADNGSGGHYGYRMAKAAANMMGKSLAMDLKGRGIAVGLIHPGMVFTNFGAGGERRPGQRDVDESVRGVVQAIDSVTMENTGCFLHGNYGEGVKPLAW